MVSLKDIAKECQVSVATVSKALNDHADISEERKKMIREKAEEMGYRPNLFARTLKTNRSYNIGVLFTDAEHNGLTHDYFAAVLDSFKVAAEARDYDLTFVNCGGSGGKRMTYLEHARYRGFDGIMIACVDFSEPEVLQLALSDIPVVTIDYIFNDRLAVVSDNAKGRSVHLYLSDGTSKNCIYPRYRFRSYNKPPVLFLQDSRKAWGGDPG